MPRKPENTCNAELIVRLLYGVFSESNHLFATKPDRDETVCDLFRSARFLQKSIRSSGNCDL